MSITRHTIAISALAAALCANNGYAQSDPSSAGFATGTEYSLLGTEKVAFGAGIVSEAKSALLFKLSNTEAVDVESGENARKWSGGLAFDRIDFLRPRDVRMYDLTDGLSYSAGVDIESSEEFDSQSEIVSSRQLGIHYGRLGPENYRSVNLGLRQISSEDIAGSDDAEDSELWSLGMTTGRRFALTGLDPSDPLWTVSLRGQFNILESDNIDEALENQQWYVSPGLQWSRQSFRLTADVLMPFMQSGELEEESDYRVRAKIQKQF